MKRKWSKPEGWQPANKGKGKTVAWLHANVSYDGDECLIWPYYRLPCGYGFFGYGGKMHYASRFMCELVNGPPPTPEHEAAHSCGRGHLGCAHPKHLSWKTKTENRRDSIRHGTSIRNPRGKARLLTPEQVTAIRKSRGIKTQASLAIEFGVSAPMIRSIQSGRSYKHVHF